MSVQILGTGSYLPPKVVTNDDLSKSLDTNDEWIHSHTGIRSRHIAEEDDCTSSMAAKAGKVIGAEIVPQAIEDAKQNARRNGVTNAVFHAADAGEFMEAMAAKGQTADVVITDPPRAGCSGKFLHSLMKLAPKRIVYVSCNPETLARDLYTLSKGGYKVRKIQPVDMFPFTSHAEVVVALERKNGG